MNQTKPQKVRSIATAVNQVALIDKHVNAPSKHPAPEPGEGREVFMVPVTCWALMETNDPDWLVRGLVHSTECGSTMFADEVRGFIGYTTASDDEKGEYEEEMERVLEPTRS